MIRGYYRPSFAKLDEMPFDDVEGWLRSLTDREFDRLWVGAIMSAIVERDLNTPQLASVLRLVRKRMRVATRDQFCRAKLNEAQVRILRRVEGVQHKELAPVFDVNESTIRRCRNRQSYL